MRGTPALVALLAVGCGGTIPDIAGVWNVTEAFADESHGLSCESMGTFVIIQPASAEPGETRPGPNFTGTLENDNDCQSVDGPFTYVGEGAVSVGIVTDSDNRLSFDANVNDAQCHYEGRATVEAGVAQQMAGELTCVLVQADVTFNLVGMWEAVRAD